MQKLKDFAEFVLLFIVSAVGLFSSIWIVMFLGWWTIPLVLFHLSLTHLFFAAIMKYKDVRDNDAFAIEVRVSAGIWLFLGYALDIALNFLWAPWIFLNPIGKWTFSDTCAKMKYKSPSAWRRKVATFICGRWLDPYERDGCHCNEPRE
jgi:hypothetical protein